MSDYDPEERAREKQRAREKDAADLASGAKTHEDLIRENSFVRAGKGPIDFPYRKPERFVTIPYEILTDEQKPLCYPDHWAIVDTEDGRVLGCDGGEPEDQMLLRDWSWVVEELNRLAVSSALDLLDAWTEADILWRSGHHSMMLGPDKMRRYTLTYRDGDRTAQANGYGSTLEAAILDALGKAPK